MAGGNRLSCGPMCVNGPLALAGVKQSLARSSKKLWTWRGSSPKLAARAKIDAGAAWGEHGHQVQERPRQYGAAQRAPPGGLNRGRSGPRAQARSPPWPGRGAGRRGCQLGLPGSARAKILNYFLKKILDRYPFPSGTIGQYRAPDHQVKPRCGAARAPRRAALCHDGQVDLEP